MFMALFTTKTMSTSEPIIIAFAFKNCKSINIPTETKNKATNIILKACRLLCTHFVDFVDDKIIPAINAPNAEDNPNSAVTIENPKHSVNATKTWTS